MKKQRLFYTFSFFVALTMLIAWQFAAAELDERNSSTSSSITEVISSAKE